MRVQKHQRSALSARLQASKFKEMEDAVDDDLTFATVHALGQAYKDGVNDEVIKGLEGPFQW